MISFFVLGGPGAGKGTQCSKIVERYQFVHLSAGDLLREERACQGSEYGTLIEDYIRNGKIVPVEMTCSLLEKAMQNFGQQKFLIDGFPRNQDNFDGWTRQMGDKVGFQYLINLRQAVLQDKERNMEELLKIVEASHEFCDELHQLKEKFIKRLSDLNESYTAESVPEKTSPSRISARTSNSKLLATVVAMEAAIDDAIVQTPQMNPTSVPSSAKVPNTEPTEVQLMPPPPAPLAPAPNDILQSSCIETSFVRPQRAAKLKSEKNLKGPRLNNTLRRPSSCDTSRVKLEHEQYPSQMHQVDEASATNRDSTKSTASVRSEDGVVAIPTNMDLSFEESQLDFSFGQSQALVTPPVYKLYKKKFQLDSAYDTRDLSKETQKDFNTGNFTSLKVFA
ncbi:uncharacterized protein LOC118734019 [Rhagoletis pomonella]|uniref:uncharacterized protein LOC118734019 n=1 Tax=Rhagoletis pomonella TaxID=28610 RepID=UPI00177D67A7|nr:uncharacterized protein LOC118734019 [Rhagoletis pomonella]